MKRGEREDRREAAEENALTEGIIGAAIKVHRELGPGLLEPAYEACLHFELGRQGYSLAGQKPQPVGCDGLLHCPVDFPWAREWYEAALAVGAVPS